MSAPERIWFTEFGECGFVDNGGTQYLRADIAASQLAEANERAEKNNDRMIDLMSELDDAHTKLAEARAERDAQLAETQRAWNERDGEKRKRLHAEAERDRLAADNARLTKERDKERKHVARLMRDLDHNRKRAEVAEARIRASVEGE
jgi:hypothetical protein